MIIAIAFFSFYSPVSFYLSANTASQFGNRVILIIFFIGIVGLSFYSLSMFDRSSRRNIEAFDNVLDQLKSRSTVDFEEDIRMVRKLFSDSLFKEVWDKYENTIRCIEFGNTDKGEIKVKYFASIESSYFFNEDVVYRNLWRYKFINYVPQLLTALGIIGTFMGLVIGLVGVDFEDVSNTKNSIEFLLNGVQISFRTSIYGIAFSLILTVFQKLLLEVQESKVKEISDKIDAIFPMNTQADGINQLYVELEKQTASIQKMGTEIAEAVSDKFDTSLQKTLGPTLEKFSQTTEQLIEVVKNSNQSTISSIVDNIGSIISSSTSQELERLQSSIGTMTERNESLLSEFEKTIQTLQSLIHSQKSIISETNQTADNAKQTNENILLVADELTKIISDLKSFAGVQQSSYDGYLELIKNVRETLEQQDKSIVLFKDMVQQTVNSYQVQKNASEKLVLVIEKLEEFNKDFQEILVNMKNGVSTFEDASENICDKFNETITKLGNTHENISISIQGLATSLTESINNLKMSLVDLQDINNQYTEIMRNIAGFSQKSDNLVNQLALFSDTNQRTVQLWENYKESFDKLNQEVNKGVEDYTLNVREGLQNLFQDYDEHISKVLSEFKSTIENFQGSIDELNDILDQQNLKEIQQQTSKIIQDGNMVLKVFSGKIDQLREVISINGYSKDDY